MAQANPAGLQRINLGTVRDESPFPFLIYFPPLPPFSPFTYFFILSFSLFWGSWAEGYRLDEWMDGWTKYDHAVSIHAKNYL